jgi:hypothetical protein
MPSNKNTKPAQPKRTMVPACVLGGIVAMVGLYWAHAKGATSVAVFMGLGYSLILAIGGRELIREEASGKAAALSRALQSVSVGDNVVIRHWAESGIEEDPVQGIVVQVDQSLSRAHTVRIRVRPHTSPADEYGYWYRATDGTLVGSAQSSIEPVIHPTPRQAP